MRHIKELFTTTDLDYSIIRKSNDTFLVEFYIEDDLFNFQADLFSTYPFYYDSEDRLTNIWEIGFGNNEVAFDQAYEITGTGNEFLVFGAVGQLMSVFIDEYNPEKMAFSAKEDSRIKLYSIFARKLVREFPQYNYREGAINVGFDETKILYYFYR